MGNAAPGTDVLQIVGNAALDAAGLGFASQIWDKFFPQGEPVFSTAQIQQLTDLFKELFAAQYYLENLDNFMSTTKLCDEYANNPTPGLLANIMVQSANTAQGILSNGYTTAQVFLSAASLHVLTLKFALEAAADPDKPGAEKNIAQGALDTLDSLLELEHLYGVAQGWQEFAAFKQATVLNNGNMSQAAVSAFGETYVKQVQELMGLVALYAPERMSEIMHPPYMMLFVPYDANSTPCTWSARSSQYQNTVYIYKCQALPPGVPSNYVPLSDLATVSVFYPQPMNPPQYVIYVAAGASPLKPPDAFQQVYNDHGSGLSRDYAGFWPLLIKKDGSTVAGGIGSYSANDDDATQPDAVQLCQLIDSSFFTQVELPAAHWDDSGTGAHEDGTIYEHPQFGAYGIYMIERSHSRPDPDTVNGLSMDALSGHPQYVPPSK